MSLSMASSERHYHGIDWLRGIAAFGIVGCHLNLSPTTTGGALLQHFCDMNVGVFGCLSGFLLCLSVSQKNNLIFTVKRRVARILPVYAFWTFIYIAAGVAFDMLLAGKVSSQFSSVSFWMSAIFNGGASCHLWYLSALFYGILVFCPVLWKVQRPQARLVIFAPLSIAFLLASFLLHGNVWFYTVRLFAFLSAGIVLYELRAMPITIPRNVCLLALTVIAVFSLKSDLWPHHFVPDYLCAILLTTLFTDTSFSANRIGKLFGETSLGVYLVHPLMTAGLGVLVRKLYGPPYSAVVVIADWLGAYLMALALTLVMLRISWIRRFVR